MDDTISKQAAIGVLPEEKTVPIPIAQYANMIISMQKLEDIRSIVQKAGYIGDRPNIMFNDNEDALLAIAAIFQGGNA